MIAVRRGVPLGDTFSASILGPGGNVRRMVKDKTQTSPLQLQFIGATIMFGISSSHLEINKVDWVEYG